MNVPNIFLYFKYRLKKLNKKVTALKEEMEPIKETLSSLRPQLNDQLTRLTEEKEGLLKVLEDNIPRKSSEKRNDWL